MNLRSRFILALTVAVISILVATSLALAAPVDSWMQMTADLDAAKSTSGAQAVAALDKAKATYDQAFAKQVEESRSKAANASVLQAFSLAKTAAQAGDQTEVAIQGQVVKKTVLGAAYAGVRNGLAKGGKDGVVEANGWMALLANQFKWDATNNHAVEEMEEIVADPTKAKKEAEEIDEIIFAQFVEKVEEEALEAKTFGDPKASAYNADTARVKAAEGLYYYRAIADLVIKKLDYGHAAQIEGALVDLMRATTNRDLNAINAAAEGAVDEVGDLKGEEAAGPKGGLGAPIAEIQHQLEEAKKMLAAGKKEDAIKLSESAEKGFFAIESRIRQIDLDSYVKIEDIFPQLKSNPTAALVDDQIATFAKVAKVDSGETKATEVPVWVKLNGMFETAHPYIFAVLALLGLYPLYLIYKAFGWRHRAWRNIGIFIVMLVIPVFMEAVGRIGTEFEIEALRSFSFQTNEFAKTVWSALVLGGFLFAISGLRQFCAQFGVHAWGVRVEEDPIVILPEGPGESPATP